MRSKRRQIAELQDRLYDQKESRLIAARTTALAMTETLEDPEYRLHVAARYLHFIVQGRDLPEVSQ